MTHRPVRRLLGRSLRLTAACALLLTGAVALPSPASAVVTAALHSSPGCSATVLPTSDDGYTGLEALPFSMELYGQTYTGLYVANDGSVGFTYADAYLGPWGGTRGGPVVAPLAHYSLSTNFGGQVTYGQTTFEGHQAFCVDWLDVGFDTVPFNGSYATAQLLIVQREDVAPGAVDLVYNYGSIGADPGINAGVSDGMSNYYYLPGSGSGGLADGSPTALTAGSTPGQVLGRYVIPVRSGLPVPPGTQAISLTTPDSVRVGDVGTAVVAESTSGLPVDVGVTGPCTLTGGVLLATGTGTCQVVANQVGGGGYAPATPVVRDVQALPRLLSLQLSGLSATYDGTPHPVTVTSTPDVGGVAVITYDGSPTPPVAAGTYVVHASVTTPDSFGEVDGVLVIAPGQRYADLYVTNPMRVGDSYYFGTAGDVSGAVYTAGPDCTVDGVQKILYPLRVGSCTLTMTLPGGGQYLDTVVARTVTVEQGQASVYLSGLAQTYDGTPRSPYVTTYPNGLTGLTTTYDGSTTAPSLPGTYTVLITLDNPDFTFTPLEATMVIGPRQQDLFFTLPATTVFGQAPLGLYGFATSALPVTYAATGPCHLEGGTLVADHIGTCSVTASQAGDATTAAAASVVRTVLVEPRPQTVVLGPFPSIQFQYNGPVTPFAYTSSGLPVLFSATGACRYADDLVHWDRAGECTVTASQPGDGDTLPATPVSVTFVVERGPQTVELYAPTSLRQGASESLYTASYLGLPVGLAVTGPCSLAGDVLTGTGVGTCTVTATQAGTADYLPTSTSRDVEVVAPTAQAISFDPLPDVRWGEPAAAPFADASSSLPVSLTAAGPCSLADGLLTYTDLGTCTLTAEQAGGDGWSAATPVSQSFSVVPGSASVALFDLQQVQGAVHAPGVVTTPAGLATSLTYDGSPSLPTAPGRYLVRATVTDPHYEPAFLETALDVAAAAVVPPGPVASQAPSPDPVVSPSPVASPSPVVSPAPSPSPSTSPSAAPSPTTSAVASPPAVPSLLPSPDQVLPASPLPVLSSTAPVVLAVLGTPTPRASAEPAPAAAASPTPSAPSAAPSGTAEPQPAAPQPADPPSSESSEEAALAGPVVDPETGERPAPAVGDGTSTLDGRSADAQVTVLDTSVQVTAGDVAVEVAALGADGAVHRPGEDATLRLDRGGNLHLVASGYEPGTEVVAWVFSDPVRLGSASAGADGSVDAVFPVPGELPGGEHTLQVNGVSAEGLRSISLGLLVDASGVPLWQLADHPDAVAATQVTFFALAGVAALGSLGAVGSALGAATGMSGAGAGLAAGAAGAGAVAAGAAPGRTTAAASEDKQRKSGKVAAAKVKHLDVSRGAESLGDRSPTWRLPGSSRVDDWGRRWPALVGPVSPLVARLMTDGAYLRAMLGSAAPTVVVSAVAAAVVAGTQTGALAAPAAAAVGLVLVLGVLDAFAGSAAALAFLTTLLLRGELDSADAVRGSLGVAALWFALPLLVGETRPLRREAARSAAAAWYRLGDVVVLPLLAAWLTLKLVGAFAGLYGHSVELTASARPLALLAGTAVLVRLLVEEGAARLYPRRLADVVADAIPSPGTAQKLSAVAVRTVMFLFVAAPFVGVRPELAVGAALFVAPQVAKIWDSRLPNLPWLHRALPSGLVKLTGLVVVGWWLSSQLKQRVDDPRDLAAVGFVVLALPPFVQGVLGLFGRSAPKPQPTWLRRVLGAVVVTASVSLVYSLTVA